MHSQLVRTVIRNKRAGRCCRGNLAARQRISLFCGIDNFKARVGQDLPQLLGLRLLDSTKLRGKPWHSTITRLLSTAEPSPQLQQAISATAVARWMSVCAVMEAVLITTGQLLPRAHDYTVRTEAENPLGYGVTMRFGISAQHTNKPRKYA
eukprot:5497050-Pleurochrysis_carterae.AAC.1